jgi:hypothetical protein
MNLKRIPKTKAEESGRDRDELLGDWYNYDTKDLPLNGQQIEHWLLKLEDTLKLRPVASKA